MRGRARLSATALRRAACCGLLFALSLVPFAGSAAAAQKVVLQLSGAPQFRYAGYYAALWQGFYREAGLDVAIVPGNSGAAKAPIDPVREVVEGRAQFGIGGTDLLLRASQGLPILLLAPIFQESAARVYFRAGTDFSSPVALWSARIGRLPASDFRDIEFRSALKAEGIDADKLRARALHRGETLKALQSKQIDAVIASAWKLPWQARESGVALKSFDPADYRVAYYGDSLFTVARYAADHPGITRRFRAASLKGWAYALRHPQPVAIRIGHAFSAPAAEKSDPLGFALYEAALAVKLSGYPGTPLGHSNPERWRRIEKNLTRLGAMLRPVDLRSFLYESESSAPQRAGPSGLAILGWTLAALFALSLLWAWRGPPRLIPSLLTRRAEERRRERGLARNAGAIVSELSEIGERLAAPLDRLFREAAAGAQPQGAGLDPRLARLRDTVTEAIGRLRAVTRRLAAYLEPARAVTRPTDLNATLSALAVTIRRRLPAGVSFRLSLLPEARLCEADADAVAASVLDLAAAAVAEMREGGELTLGTRQFEIDRAKSKEWPGSAPGAYVRLTVRDNGPGLSPERLEAVLNWEATTRPSAAAAAEMARRLGGFARVESAEGVGTAVHLYFKRRREEAVPLPGEPAKAAE